MANDNYTENTQPKAYEELFCSTDLTQGIHSQLIFLSGLNILFCFTAFFGNAVILVALHKENSLYAPSKLLLRCLAITDLFVGLIVEPLEVTFWISLVHHERSSICRYALAVSAITGYTMCLVSLFTSTAIAVERLLALSLGLRYRQVVTFKRTRISITAIWIVSIFGSTGYLWSHPISEWYGYIAMGLCLIVSSFSYTKIFITLSHRRYQVHAQHIPGNQSHLNPINIARFKKAVSSALWFQLTLVACYLPYIITGAFLTERGLTPSGFIANEFALTLLYANSSLNPILYCWKIREVRQAVKDTIRQLFCQSTLILT